MVTCKRFLAFLLILPILVMLPVSAEEGEMIVSEVYKTESTDFNYSFDEVITKDGDKYILTGVDYKVISTRDLEREEVVKESVEYDNLYSKNADAEEEIQITKDGKDLSLKLDSVSYKDTTITGRYTQVSAKTDFDYKVLKPEPAKYKTVEYYDEYTGRVVKADIPLKELVEEDEWAWRADVEIPVTFHIYDSDYYVLGDVLIPFNNDKPQLQGNEEELLNALDLDTSLYRITDINWVGEPYMVGEVKLRDAVAVGERYCANYVAVYEDTHFELPDVQGYNAEAVYKTTVSELTGIKEYTVEANALYEKDNSLFVGIMSIIVAIVMLGLGVFGAYLYKKRFRDK